MKTTMKIGILTVLVIAALAFTGFAYANSNGVGMQDMLSGTFNMPMHSSGTMMSGDGILHEYMQDAWAEVLGLEIDVLQARLDDGQTYYEIARELELVESQDEFFDLINTVRTIAIANAVEDGVVTPEQAQIMLQHMNRMGGAGMLGRMNKFGGMKTRGEGTPFGPLSYQSGLVEEFLGLTREHFQARLQNGESFEEIITSQGKTVEEWAAFSLQAHTDRLNEAVAGGNLTQEQADAMLLQMQERYENGWLEPIGPMGPYGTPGEGGPSFGMPGMYGPGEPSGACGEPGDGGASWGSPGMHSPGGHHSPNQTPSDSTNGNGGNNK